MDDSQKEAIAHLEDQIKVLKISSKEELEEPDEPLTLSNVLDRRNRAKKVFGLLMRAGYRTEGDEHSKFQPCKDDLEFLKRMDPALCVTLRFGTLKDFCNTLHPIDDDVGDDIQSTLERKDSIFHLHGNRLQDDVKEFKDLTGRAKVLAKEILDQFRKHGQLDVSLLDGHGRMLVCLIQALIDLNADPDEVLRLKVFEIDEDVHAYHQYVFPTSVIKYKQSILSQYPQPYSVVYLNFCSIKSGKDGEAWKSHFNSQTIYDWVPHCCKENVLKYIWKIVHPPYSCTVMVSLVIKHMGDDKEYHTLYKRTLGDYITGLGFLHLLRKQDLFDAEIVSIRPDDGIVWEDRDERRNPKKLKSGKWGNPFVTLLVKPKKKKSDELQKKFDNWKIADLEEETMQRGARVKVVEGTHADKRGTIVSRTPAMLQIDVVAGGGQINVRLDSVVRL